MARKVGQLEAGKGKDVVSELPSAEKGSLMVGVEMQICSAGRDGAAEARMAAVAAPDLDATRDTDRDEV